jgi:hypothetical protein
LSGWKSTSQPRHDLIRVAGWREVNGNLPLSATNWKRMSGVPPKQRVAAYPCDPMFLKRHSPRAFDDAIDRRTSVFCDWFVLNDQFPAFDVV